MIHRDCDPECKGKVKEFLQGEKKAKADTREGE